MKYQVRIRFRNGDEMLAHHPMLVFSKEEAEVLLRLVQQGLENLGIARIVKIQRRGVEHETSLAECAVNRLLEQGGKSETGSQDSSKLPPPRYE